MKENIIAKNLLEGKNCDTCIHRDGNSCGRLITIMPTTLPKENTCINWKIASGIAFSNTITEELQRNLKEDIRKWKKKSKRRIY